MKYFKEYINNTKVLFSSIVFVITVINSLNSQNHSCANAELIVPANVPQCQNSPINGSGDISANETELWYKFTATSTSHSLIFTDDFYPFGFCNPTVNVHQGVCGTLQSILQIQTVPNELIDTSINNLIIGNDYWIQITCSSYLTVEFCLGTLPPNGVCSGAIEVATSTEETCSYTSSVETPDAWYKFQATANNYKIRTKSDWDQVFIVDVYDGDCGLIQSTIGSDASEFIGPNPIEPFYYQESNMILSNLTPGQIYYIKVTDATNYIDICLRPTPENDECTGAVEVALSDINDSACNPIIVNTSCATQSSQITCTGLGGLDLWYSFHPSASIIQIQAFKGYLEIDSSIRVELYSDAICDNPNNTEIVCHAVFGGRFLRTSVIPGDEYYIRVISDQPLADISLCIYQREPPELPNQIWSIDTVTQEVYTLDNNVGINAPDPERSLDVVGQVRIDFQSESASSQALEVLGNVSISGELTTDSDLRYKKSIKPIDSALSKIEALRPVSYKYDNENFPAKHFPERTKMGLIAQEVELVLPNIVKTNAEGYKAINYSELIPLLLQAIKELKNEVEVLKGE